MARLDAVVNMLNERRKPAAAPTESAQPPSLNAYLSGQIDQKLAYSGSPFVDHLINLLAHGSVKPEDVKEGLLAIASGISALDQGLQDVAEAVAKRPESLDPVIAEVVTLRSAVVKMVEAIRAIKLPEFPKIPESKDVDFTPIKSELMDMRVLIASLNRVAEKVEEIPESGPTEWVFEVKRNRAGYIKTVEAKAK